MDNSYWFYYYKIRFLDEEDDYKEKIASGLIEAKNHSKAMIKIEDYYGSISDVLHLIPITDTCFEFNEENLGFIKEMDK